ncbi:hypothetical protein PHYSODRAFT_488355 [Phytophthora sojae]|uniref:EF-hand domain-containing protein n=1 Tax=Phytophthora sojae (strain P6497) TaxID=1094619 RepID=G4Z3D7_PHYSP|nr:hypothetical protein PHYSODRAFT_488355 [Phytophthora sojae]EGZ21500.1 hypothetical protein PHYSODRAFT_488355 [Phytophthora sojae]|eukprot:XP_009524217.1 hypothetical protein PHYSODRAFT_488355 [Phytophthora sojae]
MKKRQALSASISAEALLVHEEQLRPSRRPVQFSITDILPENQKTGKKTEATLPISPTTLGPLSLPRPGKNDAFYAERLEQAENTELFTYASALCHRVTGRYLPRALLQRDPEAQQRELERVQRDPEILRAIDSVRVLSAQFKDVAQTTMGHRRELGHTLFRIEESYLKLFEKLLELSLRLYWEYEQRTEAQRREDRATAELWREKYERKCAECVKINKKMAAREIIHRAREIELQDYRGQMKEIEKELGNQRELEAQILQLQHATTLQRVLERKLRDDFAQLTKTHEEMIEYQKQLREEDRFIVKQEVTLKQLEEIVAIPPVVYESRSSQTEVDDDGLWDVQDGIPRFVSKNALHKMMWRRFNAFVACKNCGGRPIPKAAKTNPFGKYPQDGSSELPSHTVLFLSNLPKSVVAFPFYSLEQVISLIEAIYDDKFVSDRADEADGVAREELPRFICEYFLKTHGLRQCAEIGLYRFLVSIKNTYQRNSHGPRRYGYLDRSFLHVFLEARHYLLRPPPRSPLKGKKAHKSEESGATKGLEHVVQVEPTKKWVPLDHAINVLRWYISCLPEDSISSYCRQVEHNTAMYDGHNIMEISGNRLAVRAEMRRVMLASEKPDSSSSSSIHAPEANKSVQRPPPPRIVVDVHKVLKLLMDALEQRRDGIKRDLTALFDAGDVNHDCVLTLDEFGAIIRKRKPHFSDRRILRMFREALMGGVDQSFALSMEAFVVVCNDHGLVSLLPDDRMVDPFAVSKPVPKPSKTVVETSPTPEAASTADSSGNITPEIPEDISSDDSVLPTARAEEVDDEEEQEGWEQPETDSDSANR